MTLQAATATPDHRPSTPAELLLAAGRLSNELQSLAASDHLEQLRTTDRIAELCWQALATSRPDTARLEGVKALGALGAALELSEMTLAPLLQIHQRAADLAAGAMPEATDAFLSHQARFLAPSLIEWTQELLQAPGTVRQTQNTQSTQRH